MKPICFIGARGGSKGVPRKNIRPILGKPLIAYTIESSLKSKIFSHVVVSTDDKEIANVAKQYAKQNRCLIRTTKGGIETPELPTQPAGEG